MFNQPILIIEDNREDYKTIVFAFKMAGLSNPVVQCQTEDDVLNYLFRRSNHTSSLKPPLPGLILLDLDMSAVDGRRIINTIKQDKDLKKIPIIILCKSNEDMEIANCYKAGADSCLSKPVSFEGFVKSIQQLGDYSLEIIVLPKEAPTEANGY
jgi:CheY-like chemotaxis protein